VQTRIGDNKLAGALFCLLERYFACWSVILLAGALFCLLPLGFSHHALCSLPVV
jgi:hypothetical protein